MEILEDFMEQHRKMRNFRKKNIKNHLTFRPKCRIVPIVS